MKIEVTASYHSKNNPYEFYIENGVILKRSPGVPKWAEECALAKASGVEYKRPKGAGDHRQCKPFDPKTKEGCLFAGRFDD